MSNNAANVINLDLDDKSDGESSSILDNFDAQRVGNADVFAESEPKAPSEPSKKKKGGGLNFVSVSIGFGLVALIAVGIWNALLLQSKNETPKSLQADTPVESAKPAVSSIQQPVFEVTEEPLPVVAPAKSEEELALEKLLELESGIHVSQDSLINTESTEQAEKPVTSVIENTVVDKSIDSADNIRLDQIESLARNGTDLAHSLVPRIDMVEKQITEQDAKLVMSQRAITQTAEVVQEVRGVVNDLNQSIKAVSAELAKLKGEQKSFEQQISVLESKVLSIAESGKVKTLSNGQIVSSVNTVTNKPAKPQEVAAPKPVAAVAPANIQESSKQDVLNNFVQITQLSVIAMTQNNAYVKDESDRKYLLTLGKTYDQLGTVENIDTNSKTIYGRFKNGKGWMISK